MVGDKKKYEELNWNISLLKEDQLYSCSNLRISINNEEVKNKRSTTTTTYLTFSVITLFITKTIY